MIHGGRNHNYVLSFLASEPNRGDMKMIGKADQASLLSFFFIFYCPSPLG